MEFLLFTEPRARTPQSLLPSSTGKLLALAAPVLGLTSPLKTPLVPALFQSPSQTVSPSRMKTECCYFCSTSPRPGQATEGQIGVQAVSLHPLGLRCMGHSKVYVVAEATSVAPGPGACPGRQGLEARAGTTIGGLCEYPSRTTKAQTRTSMRRV